MRIIKDEEQMQLIDEIHQSYKEHMERMSKVKSTINSGKKRRKPKTKGATDLNELKAAQELPLPIPPPTKGPTKAHLSKQIQNILESTKTAEGPIPKARYLKKPLQLKKEAAVPLDVVKTAHLNKFSLLIPAIVQKPNGKSLTKTYSATVATSFRNVTPQRERMLVEVLPEKLAVAEQKSFSLKIPENVLVHYSEVTRIYDEKLLTELLRPSIYLNFMSRDKRNYGRIVFQLFTEACPGIVTKFIEGVSGNEHERINIKRIFTNLWMEATLTLQLTDKKILNSATLEHSFRALNHRLGAGVLSFPVRHIFGSCHSNSLPFSISLKPLDVIYGQRVAFGIVRSGHWILEQLHEFATKTGKMTEDIFVSGCGLL